MKYLKLMFVGLIFGCGLSAFLKISSSAPTVCNVQYRNDLKITAGTNTINSELALTDNQRNTGLGKRKCIGPEQGMLFVFKKPDYYPFWMKDMKFPIDIIWINQNKTVNKVKADVSPSTYPGSFTNSQPAMYILEIQAGRAQQLNITEGTSLQFNL
jgi:uncharacterized membrane protein (UPF0127 family)